MYGRLIFVKTVIEDPYHPSLSPALGLDSERVFFLGLAVDWALALGVSGNGELKDGGRFGADCLLARRFESCEPEGNPLRDIDSGLEPVRLRFRDSG